MDHADHVRLIREGVEGGGRIWADLGSGRGAFTLALADLLGPGGVIHSVDVDRRALEEQRRRMGARFPDTAVHYHHADMRSVDLPELDGVVMANSLYFVADKEPLLRRLRARLRPAGRLVLVEYDSDRGNPWVPHPLSYSTWESLAARCGFRETRRLATVPSRFLGRIYSALSLSDAPDDRYRPPA